MNTQDSAKKCPLCGKDNGCCVGQSDCWCFSQKVPKELIDQVSPALKNKACICNACIEAFNKELHEKTHQ